MFTIGQNFICGSSERGLVSGVAGARRMAGALSVNGTKVRAKMRASIFMHVQYLHHALVASQIARALRTSARITVRRARMGQNGFPKGRDNGTESKVVHE